MYCVIVGCGMVGSRVATMLTRNGDSVAVVDQKSGAFNKLPSEFDGITVHGCGFDESILKRAGIDQADVFAALTENDNVNIIASAVAKTIFKVKRVITRVYNPDREKTFRVLGLEIVSPTILSAEQVYSRFIMGENSANLYINQDFEIMEHVYEPIGKGETVGDLEDNNDLRIIAIIRKHKMALAKNNYKLIKGDRIITAINIHSIHTSSRVFGTDKGV
ncbi:MAG: TrkA family potassium uptake protein [Caldisericia bacterium]|nr:TrkA family potassium uptake protein [Caldisericia bacterium]